MKKALIIGSIVLVIGTAAYWYYKKQVQLLQDMSYDFLKVKVGTLSEKLVEIMVSIMVKSNSTLEAEITELVLDVYFDGIKVGTITESKPIIIPAKGSSIVDLKVSISPDQLRMNALDLFKSWFTDKDAVIMINGYGKVKSAFIKTSVPFVYNTSLKEITS